jgi:hypothetical protein
MLRIKFDGPDQPQVIQIEPDDAIDFTEWVKEGGDWVLVVHFGKDQRKFGWSGDQVRIIK